jgi:hypothetical protein
LTFLPGQTGRNHRFSWSVREGLLPAKFHEKAACPGSFFGEVRFSDIDQYPADSHAESGLRAAMQVTQTMVAAR